MEADAGPEQDSQGYVVDPVPVPRSAMQRPMQMAMPMPMPMMRMPMGPRAPRPYMRAGPGATPFLPQQQPFMFSGPAATLRRPPMQQGMMGMQPMMRMPRPLNAWAQPQGNRYVMCCCPNPGCPMHGVY